MKLSIGHALNKFGWQLEELITVTKSHDNIFLDTTGSLYHFGVLKQLVDAVGAGRILLGTDIPFLEPAFQLGKIIYEKRVSRYDHSRHCEGTKRWDLKKAGVSKADFTIDFVLKAIWQ